MLGPATDDLHVPASRRRRERPAAGGDAVGHDVVLRRVERVDAVDLDGRRAGPAHVGAHGDEELGDVGDLRLAGGVLDAGVPGGEHRGHEDVLGGPDARELQVHARAVQPLGGCGDEVPVGDVDLRAQGLEALGVQIEAARADGVAAGHRDVRLADARDEGSEDTDGGPQRTDQLVVGPVPDALGDVDLDDTVLRPPVDVAAQPPEQLGHDRHVDDVRDVGESGAPHGEQRAGHQLQRAVLGSDDADLSPEAGAAGDPEPFPHPPTVATAGVRRPVASLRERVARLAHGQPHADLHTHRRRRHHVAR